MNKRSSNFLAEMVFRAVAVDASEGRWAATAEDGARAVAEHLARLGVLPEEAWVVNGSGLTRDHKLSPRALTTVLAHAASDPRFGDEFVASLSVAGTDGTLARRMTASLPGQVRGKTGTLNGVVGLCGTFVGGDDETYAFAVLSNDGPSSGAVRTAMDALVTRWLAATRLPVEGTGEEAQRETSSAQPEASRPAELADPS
jgi:D-alanyl-D-alanine carboxypeptidase/D-alanyl-D-alanine-endopeptidase (penicillin-binding protein 4)